VLCCASFCCCVLMEYVLLLLACFNWVCQAIWPSESSIRLPSRGSHWFEWIKPGWSTGIGSVGQLSVCMLKSCKHASKLHDYSYFNQQKVAWSITLPCLLRSSCCGCGVFVKLEWYRFLSFSFWLFQGTRKKLFNRYSPAQVGIAWGSIVREF
jgi:hypothetical protein